MKIAYDASDRTAQGFNVVGHRVFSPESVGETVAIDLEYTFISNDNSPDISIKIPSALVPAFLHASNLAARGLDPNEAGDPNNCPPIEFEPYRPPSNLAIAKAPVLGADGQPL